MLRRDHAERELDQEHAFHIEMETERLLREGVEATEARRRALVAFGGVERFQQEVRESRWTWGLEQVGRDARHALRALGRRPLFALSAVGTMAVAIGAATTLFSAVEAVLLRPLPVYEPDRVVSIGIVTETGEQQGAVSLPDYLDYRSRTAAALDLAAHRISDVTLSGEGGAIASLAMEVSGSYFRVLGLAPAAGRFFVEEGAEQADAPTEAVLSHDHWRSAFGTDPTIIGETLHVNGQPLTVVGVAPEGFQSTMLGARPPVFLPVGLHERLQGREIDERTGREWLQLFGRLAPGASREGAAAAFEVAAAQLAATYDYAGREPRGATLEPFSPLPPRQRAVAARATLLLMGAAAVLLLIATVNVAGMLLARASRREPEMSLRLALGAGRRRLTGQLLVEGLVLGGLAGVAGIGVAALAARLVEGVSPPGLETVFRLELPVDARVAAFALACGLLTSLVFGLLPARHATSSEPGAGLRRGGWSRSATRGRAVLVGAQVAMTLVLLVSTALLLRTLANAIRVDHGFEVEGLVMGELDLRLNGYDEVGGMIFYESLLERLEASPAVASAALSTSIPLGLGWDQTRASVPGLESPDPSGWVVGWSAVSDRYFETLGYAFRAGTRPDGASEPARIIVNDALAELFWSDPTPVGRGLRFSGRDAEVAGVLPTGKYRSLAEEARLFAWVPLEVSPSLALYVHVRPSAEPAAAAAALRREVAALDPHVPLITVTTLEAAMEQSLFFQRTAAGFIGAFALMALLLSATGIFGLLAYTVEQRTREIGIRMAMGAGASGVVRSVVRKGLAPVAVGLLLGLGGARLVARLLQGLLYDVPAGDLASFGVAAVLLLVVGAVAAAAPALRATRVDPAATLKAE
ncbi:MAG TPA: ADOP family duplicated permease [Longimicrobiales bacterium]|nr:ADOP family duplicated permease [Longimicrobiales bacterium]